MIRFDYLGAAHPKFPWMKALAIAPAGSAICVLDCEDTFGRALKKVKRGFSRHSDKFHYLVVHLHWSKSHKIVPMKKLRKKLPQWERFAQDFPGVKVFLSHSLEYAENSAKEVQARVEAINELAPSCYAVNCVWTGYRDNKTYTERHGANLVGNGKEIISTDGAGPNGTGILNIDAERFFRVNRNALMAAAWAPRFNLLLNMGKKQNPPYLKRTAKPNAPYIKGVERMTRPKGDAPIPLTGSRPISNSETHKPFADDKPGSGSRANKPVFITKIKATVAKVLNANGKRIGKMPHSGMDEEGQGKNSLYRFGKYGFQLAEKAKKTAGSEFVYLQVGKDLIGPFHPAFRYN